MARVVMAGVLALLIGGAAEVVQAQGVQSAGGEKVITEQNLFHPNRILPNPSPPKAPPKPVAAPLPPPPAPKFILSGVVLDGDTRMALLQEPGLTQNQPLLVKYGQSVGPYRLTAVQQDQVALLGPAGEVVVPLHNPTKLTAATPRQPGGPTGFVRSLQDALQQRGGAGLVPTPAPTRPAPPDAPSSPSVTADDREEGEQRRRDRSDREQGKEEKKRNRRGGATNQ